MKTPDCVHTPVAATRAWVHARRERFAHTHSPPLRSSSKALYSQTMMSATSLTTNSSFGMFAVVLSLITIIAAVVTSKNYLQRSTERTEQKPAYSHWDSLNDSLDTDFPRNPKASWTSLEILENILSSHSQEHWNSFNVSSAISDCFVADTRRTQKTVETLESEGSSLKNLRVLNLGMPKCGSTSFTRFFQCGNTTTDHWLLPKTAANAHEFVGECYRSAADNHLPPMKTCDWKASSPRVFAHLQMDVVFPSRGSCFFPQIQLLDELHAEDPSATFLLNFRPLEDWYRSLGHWGGMDERLSRCDVPGLQPEGGEMTISRIGRFWCSHVYHVREFVRRHPSHHLIELDLYDTNSTSWYLSKLFGIPRGCWGHAGKKGPNI